MMHVFSDYLKFSSEVIKLSFEDFDNTGITPCRAIGIFSEYRAKELEEFCARNPDIHVVSFLKGGTLVNRLCKNASFYLLAKGSSDPSLFYCEKTNHAAVF